MRSKSSTIAILVICPCLAAFTGRVTGAEAQDIPGLIQGLGDSRFHVREESQRALISRGSEAVAPLELAALSPDLEIAQRARLILNQVDPLVVRVRIQEIELDPSPRISGTLIYEGKESEEESKEVLLPESGDAERSVRYAVSFRPLPEDRIELSIDEMPVNSMAMRTPLLPASRVWGAVSILKRGEEGLYRQMGSHLERERHPYLVTVQWWTERSLKRPGAFPPRPPRGGGPPAGAGGGTGEAGGLPPEGPSKEIPENGLDEFFGELLGQAESKDSRSRETAIELLGLLRTPEAAGALRVAAVGPEVSGSIGDGEEGTGGRDLRLAALVGLTRAGDAVARASLSQALAALSQRPALPRPEAARPRKGRKMLSTFKSPVESGRLSAGFWPTRAAVALVEAGEPAGFEHFARRIVDVDPADVHLVLACLADRLDRVPASCRDLLLEGLASPELILHLPWDDPEVEYFYGRLREITGRPEDSAYRERLVLTLARTLWTDSGLASTRLRTFSRLWDRMTGGAAAPDLAEKVLKEVLGSAGSPLPIHELVPWLAAAFRERPMPEAEFQEVLALLRSVLGRSQSAYTAMNAAVEIARWPALTAEEAVQIAMLLAEMGSLPNQPSSQECLVELQRLTGLDLPPARRARPAVSVPSPLVPPEGTVAPSRKSPPEGTVAPSRKSPPGGTGAPARKAAGPSAGDPTIVELVARWAADPEQVRAALARRASPGGDAGSEPLEYWEFDFLVPYRQAKPAPGKQAPAEKSLEPQLLDARRVQVRSGLPFSLSNRWGGSVLHRIDPERSTGGARYRLNWQSVLELDLPAFVSLKEEDQTVFWYATSDVRLGATPISKPYGLQHQKLACIKKASGSAPESTPEEPTQVWQSFCRDLVDTLESQRDERRARSAITIIQSLRIREAATFIRQEFERRPDPSLAQTLAELGDLEFLRSQLGGDSPPGPPRGGGEGVARRFQAAQALAGACDRSGLRTLLDLLRTRPREVTPYVNGAISGLDNFLANCDPTPEERAEVIDLVVANLEEGIFQYRGFPLLSREAGIDFKFSQTFQIPNGPGRKEAVKRAVDAARSWWSSQRPR